jgi:hypothetical protein
MEVQNVADEAFVKFSVQGSSFMLPRAAVEAIDWMPRNMINSPLKGDLVNDVHYLDCDASSFRMLYQIGKGGQDVSDFSHLSCLEISLLKNTAQYLAMSEVLPQLDQLLISKVEPPKNAKIADALALYEAVEKAVDRSHVTAWRCLHTRPRYNSLCHNRIITFCAIKDEVYTGCNICDKECAKFNPYPIGTENSRGCTPISHIRRINDITTFIQENI